MSQIEFPGSKYRPRTGNHVQGYIKHGSQGDTCKGERGKREEAKLCGTCFQVRQA